jgi:hypothetical protein
MVSVQPPAAIVEPSGLIAAAYTSPTFSGPTGIQIVRTRQYRDRRRYFFWMSSNSGHFAASSFAFLVSKASLSGSTT